mmetsp:Transcript_137084/g.238372  ORF Transcript_137084/g.238372 Transcript_137084/m.238372 type:complete len:114 (+) Transcript_137084:1160-1501(+)
MYITSFSSVAIKIPANFPFQTFLQKILMVKYVVFSCHKEAVCKLYLSYLQAAAGYHSCHPSLVTFATCSSVCPWLSAAAVRLQDNRIASLHLKGNKKQLATPSILNPPPNCST